MGDRKYKGLRNVMIVFLVILAIFLYGIIGLNNYDGYKEEGFYALLFVSFTGLVTCMVLIPYFAKRGKRFREAMNASSQYAYWELDDDLVQRTAEQKLKDNKERNKALLIIMTFFFVLFTGIFAFTLEGEELGMFVVLMAGIFAFISLFAIFVPKISYARTYSKAKDVYLGPNSVVIGKEFHIFNSAFDKFDKAEYNGDKNMIIIKYKSLNRTGMTPYIAEVPVPIEHEKIAIDYIVYLKGLHGKK